MAKISALLHAEDNEETIRKTIESLGACNDVLVVDHFSSDRTSRLARKAGARVVRAIPGVDEGAYAIDCENDWILCIHPHEVVDAEMAASLAEWRKADHPPTASFAMEVKRVDGASGGAAGVETRLVNRTMVNWKDRIPTHNENASVLKGGLLTTAAEKPETA